MKPFYLGGILIILGLCLLLLDSEALTFRFESSSNSQISLPKFYSSKKCEIGPFKYDDIDISLESKEKYFMYSPSGGFSNQRTELESGLLISKILNRTLIIPKAAKHTTWWSKYHELGHEDLLSMDRVFDFSLINQNFDFVIANSTVAELENQTFELAKSISSSERKSFELIKPRHRPNWRGRDEIIENLNSNASFLFLKGSAMYHTWFNGAKRHQEVTNLLPFKQCLRFMAIQMMEKIVNDANLHHLGEQKVRQLNAMHIRLGDYYKHGRAPSVRKLIAEMKEKGYRTEDPIYIATEPKRIKKFFRPLEEAFPLIFYSDRFQFIRMKLEEQFPHNMVDDVLGMIEQLVCLFAHRFIGTSYSNFSNYISLMRNASTEVMFPERDQVIRNLRLDLF